MSSPLRVPLSFTSRVKRSVKTATPRSRRLLAAGRVSPRRKRPHSPLTGQWRVTFAPRAAFTVPPTTADRGPGSAPVTFPSRDKTVGASSLEGDRKTTLGSRTALAPWWIKLCLANGDELSEGCGRSPALSLPLGGGGHTQPGGARWADGRTNGWSRSERHLRRCPDCTQHAGATGASGFRAASLCGTRDTPEGPGVGKAEGTGAQGGLGEGAAAPEGPEGQDVRLSSQKGPGEGSPASDLWAKTPPPHTRP